MSLHKEDNLTTKSFSRNPSRSILSNDFRMVIYVYNVGLFIGRIFFLLKDVTLTGFFFFQCVFLIESLINFRWRGTNYVFNYK